MGSRLVTRINPGTGRIRLGRVQVMNRALAHARPKTFAYRGLPADRALQRDWLLHLGRESYLR
jgi:hypothetical protein